MLLRKMVTRDIGQEVESVISAHRQRKIVKNQLHVYSLPNAVSGKFSHFHWTPKSIPNP